ncbi:hypothetical protein EK904_002578, partial [Melospiza melodia maxima]
VSTLDWVRAEKIYNLCEVLFKIHKDFDLEDQRPYCFSVMVGHGKSHYFNVELGSELAVWEKSFQRAIFLEVQRTGIFMLLDFPVPEETKCTYGFTLHGRPTSVEKSEGLSVIQGAFMLPSAIVLQLKGDKDTNTKKEAEEEKNFCVWAAAVLATHPVFVLQPHHSLSKTYMCSWQGDALCFTVDFALGFTCFDSKTKNVLWRFKFSQLKGSSDDGKTRVKLLFQNTDTKQIETKELEFQDLTAVLHCIHSFIAAKVASVDPHGQSPSGPFHSELLSPSASAFKENVLPAGHDIFCFVTIQASRKGYLAHQGSSACLEKRGSNELICQTRLPTPDYPQLNATYHHTPCNKLLCREEARLVVMEGGCPGRARCCPQKSKAGELGRSTGRAAGKGCTPVCRRSNEKMGVVAESVYMLLGFLSPPCTTASSSRMLPATHPNPPCPLWSDQTLILGSTLRSPGKDTIFEQIEDNCITKAIQKGSSLVDYAAHYEIKRKIQGSEIATPTLLLAFSKFPEQESQEISQAAERMEMSIQVLKQKVCQRHKRSLHPTDHLSADLLTMIAKISGCLPYMLPPKCPNNCLANEYRLITGACNNREHPRWGASNTALARWLPAAYEDGLSQPRGWDPSVRYNGFPLPSVRKCTSRSLETHIITPATTDLHLHQ